jgi:putative NIF3 family GTP cyclohydrolase 1 type 2
VNAVVRAYVQAHPYEEPAFDIYPVEDLLPRAGLGRVGRLVRPSTVTEFAGLIAEAIDVVSLEYSGDGTQTVERVAVVPGSGQAFCPRRGAWLTCSSRAT